MPHQEWDAQTSSRILYNLSTTPYLIAPSLQLNDVMETSNNNNMPTQLLVCGQISTIRHPLQTFGAPIFSKKCFQSVNIYSYMQRGTGDT